MAEAAAADLLSGPRRTIQLNRRELFRVPVALPIEVSLSRNHAGAISATTLDISQGGARVFLPSRLDQEQTVWFSLRLNDGEVISASATVRHCVRETNGYATGLAFGVFAPADSRALAQAMGRHQRRLGPQVHSDQLVHWTTPPSGRSRPGTAIAISPGAVAMHTQDELELGHHGSLTLRAGRENFVLGATVVDHHSEEERNRSLLALDVLDRAQENQLRAALHQLADEEHWSER